MVLTYQGPSGLTQISTVPVKFADISGIDSVNMDVEAAIMFDRATSTATITSATAICSVEAYDVSGRRADTETSLNGNGATVKISGNGVFFICVKDENGKSQTFKIVK